MKRPAQSTVLAFRKAPVGGFKRQLDQLSLASAVLMPVRPSLSMIKRSI